MLSYLELFLLRKALPILVVRALELDPVPVIKDPQGLLGERGQIELSLDNLGPLEEANVAHAHQHLLGGQPLHLVLVQHGLSPCALLVHYDESPSSPSPDDLELGA